MKQKISGPAGVIVIVVVALLALFVGWSTMIKGPSTITPDEMRKNMSKGREQMEAAAKRQQDQNRGPRGGMGGYGLQGPNGGR